MSDEKTIDVEVCDIAVFRRTVAIPMKCPDCGADLTKESALRVWEYQDQQRHATVVLHDGEPTPDGQLDWPDLPRAGDSYMQMSFECGSCGKKLAEGKEANVQVGG